MIELLEESGVTKTEASRCEEVHRGRGRNAKNLFQFGQEGYATSNRAMEGNDRGGCQTSEPDRGNPHHVLLKKKPKIAGWRFTEGPRRIKNIAQNR